MLGIIKRLSEPLANKIAAGEVVERPASIIKELVENAIDAKATVIEVEVEEGGLKKIRIADNGHGFAPEDCEIAFERHATSKIHHESDLFHIRSLGFRGEALPSIASVSYLDLVTSTGEGPGTHLKLEGGRVIEKNHAQSRKGSIITVTHLFYNTPARLKYLKTIHTELGKITDMMNRLALSYPNTRFTLKHNDKLLFQTNGSGDLAQVLAAIYGIQTARKTLPFKGESLDFKIHGLLVKPELTRAGRQYVYIFINGRYIKNFRLFNAITNGYHTLLPIGRNPIAILHITMDPTLVDVNVHPAKLEARISKENELCELIENTVRARFHQENLIPEVPKKERKEKVISKQQFLKFEDVNSNTEQSMETTFSDKDTFEIEVKDIQKNPNSSRLQDPLYSESLPSEVHEETLEIEQVNEVKNDVDVENDWRTLDKSPIEPSKEEEISSRIPKLYPIGQMHGTYILAQNEEGLYIIDQHAAQERIKYEFFREKVGQTTKEVQELLVPLTFEFTAAEYATIHEYKHYLEDIGLYFEEFGQHTLIVRSHPRWFPKGKEKETIEDIVHQLIQERHISIKKLRESLAIMMSCKGSIKANRYLRDDEIEALLDQLRQASDPFTCPHGRPVIIKFSTYEMEKMFKRVM